jgi:NAD(P)-dependent dehydrogenase (short-subunit alcohol dehydrogenase family)
MVSNLKPPSAQNMVVVIGVSGIGLAITKRVVHGRKLLLADFSDETLETAAKVLQEDGYDDISTYKVDISDCSSVENLARTAEASGNMNVIIHTAGVSPAVASAKQIY